MFTVILGILFNMVLKIQVQRVGDLLLSSPRFRLTLTCFWQLAGLSFHELLKRAGQLPLGSSVEMRNTMEKTIPVHEWGQSRSSWGDRPYKLQVSP